MIGVIEGGERKFQLSREKGMSFLVLRLGLKRI
jgi:hypothetical protein